MGIELYPTAEPQFVGPAEDIEAIRQPTATGGRATTT